jgi:Tol biopolymer transport system component
VSFAPSPGSTGPAATGVIAFHADPEGDSGLYVTDANGTGVRLVAGSLAGYPFSRWRPDGSQLAFLVGSFGEGSLHLVGYDGSNDRSLGDARALSAFAWSADGGRLVYEDADKGGIWLIDADGTSPAMELVASGHPTEWSPDGEWIAYFDGPDGASSIYRIRLDGSPAEALTDGGGDVSPSWSPDGTQIAFVSSRDDNLELYVMAADGSGVRRLTDDSAPDDIARWGPDGTHIVYVSYRDGADPSSIGIGDAEIYSVDVKTATTRDISNDPAWDGDPAWSPDGAWIAFTRRTDHGELYVMRPDGAEQRMLPGFASAQYNDCCPTWRPLVP